MDLAMDLAKLAFDTAAEIHGAGREKECLCVRGPEIDCPILRHHREAMDAEEDRLRGEAEFMAEMEWEEEQWARECDEAEKENL